MDGIYYGLSMVAVFVVIFWYVRNDGKLAEEQTVGLLAMRHTATVADLTLPSIKSSNSDLPLSALEPAGSESNKRETISP